MSNSNIHYWDKALKRYAEKDWVNKPTLFAEQIIHYLPASGNMLELGSGQGQDALFFANKGYEVVATDLVDTGLKLCEEKAKTKNLSIQFKIVDIAEALPFADASFDIVYSHLGLHYLNKEKTRELFSEIHRIVKPKGIIVALFNSMDDPEIHSNEFEKIEEHYYKEVAFDFYKRYFTVEDTQQFIDKLFEPILLDNQGQTYKDEIKTLIRLVGRRVDSPV